MSRFRTLLALFFLASCLAEAQDGNGNPDHTCTRPRIAGSDDAGAHQIWDGLVRSYVEAGFVHYCCIAENRAELARYLEVLAATDPESLDRPGKLAFWTNAYNAFTVELILSEYPGIESITDLSGPWKRESWVVGGETLSLDHIEHEILRPMGEPRIHFAIVCASKSCPDLRSEAYVPERIEEQLVDATRGFLTDKVKGFDVKSEPGALYGTNHNVTLSKIFDWFGEDFRKSGELLDWLKPWLPESGRTFLAAHEGEISIRSFDYDWSLNGR